MGDLDRTIRRDHGSSEVQVFIRYLTSSRDYVLGQEQEIKKERIEIGRDSSCDIRFSDKQKTVSRKHAIILRENRDWILKNISDSNPTLINGRPLKKGWFLSSGDIIQLSYEGPKLEFIVKTIKKQETSPKKDIKEEVKVIMEEIKDNDDKLETVYQVISFCIPLVGAIIWISNMKSSPNKAKTACYAALLGIGFSFVLNVIAGVS